jgi:hypothetical protein
MYSGRLLVVAAIAPDAAMLGSMVFAPLPVLA